MLQPRMFSSLARLSSKAPIVMAKNLSNKAEHEPALIMPKIMHIHSELAVTSAAQLILSGNAIALPTDTIYGIAVSAQDKKAVQKLYEIKRRDYTKPIAICVGKINDIHLWGDSSYLESGLLESLLPGPVTVVLKRKSALNKHFNPGNPYIGMRIPDFPFIQELANVCDVPIALTSANISNEKSSLAITEFQHIWPHLTAVFDNGISGASREGSTVVDLSKPGHFKILRNGSALESTTSVLKNFNLKEE